MTALSQPLHDERWLKSLSTLPAETNNERVVQNNVVVERYRDPYKALKDANSRLKAGKSIFSNFGTETKSAASTE